MKNKIISINISTRTIIKTILILIGLWFIIYIRGIIGIFLVSLLLTAALKPTIDWLERKKIPRIAGITIVYIALATLFILSIILIIPPMVQQSKQLAENFPNYWKKLSDGITFFKEYSYSHGWQNNINELVNTFKNSIGKFAGNIFGAVSSIFGGVASVIFILVLTFYMTLEKNSFDKIVNLLIPLQYKEQILEVEKKIEAKIGYWVRGQIVLMAIVGVLCATGLFLLGINYALVLGLIAGITELIPYLGPMIGAIPAVFIAFTQSPIKALFVIILYFGIQELENDILVPKIMERAVGLNPIIGIFALLIGAKIAGILGILLSIPVTTSIIIILKEFYPYKKS